MPRQFTMLHRDQANDITDTSGDVGLTGVTGPLLFVPTFKPGSRLPTSDGTVCPREFPAYLDTDGRLKPARGGVDGIRLWANDPEFGIERFQYHVRAPEGLTDLLGHPVPWLDFYFDAPGVDGVRYLNAYVPRPGQKFGRGPGAPGLSGGSFNDSDLLLQNADGSTLTPIGVPSGIVVLINNGDGTGTIGPT